MITGQWLMQLLYLIGFIQKFTFWKKNIRRKLRKFKDLPTANFFPQKVKEKDSHFCPVSYLSDEENYFEKIMEERKKKDGRKILKMTI